MSDLRSRMVEAMARAIADAMHDSGDYGMRGVDAFERRPEEFAALARAALTAALAVLDEAGWKVVPVKPTPAMADAMDEIDVMWGEIYDIALAAAPDVKEG